MNTRIYVSAVALALFVGLIGLGIYFLPERAENGTASVAGAAARIPSGERADVWKPPPPREAPSGLKEYRHLTYDFSILYPEYLSVKEFKEKGTALTVTFQDVGGDQKFQVFVVPYGYDEITPERRALDIPSGVYEEPQDILIDGAPAVAFKSTDAIIGETREIWFIRGGFLYEVTANRALDEWLSGIMTTWKFL